MTRFIWRSSRAIGLFPISARATLARDCALPRLWRAFRIRIRSYCLFEVRAMSPDWVTNLTEVPPEPMAALTERTNFLANT